MKGIINQYNIKHGSSKDLSSNSNEENYSKKNSELYSIIENLQQDKFRLEETLRLLRENSSKIISDSDSKQIDEILVKDSKSNEEISSKIISELNSQLKISDAEKNLLEMRLKSQAENFSKIISELNLLIKIAEEEKNLLETKLKTHEENSLIIISELNPQIKITEEDKNFLELKLKPNDENFQKIISELNSQVKFLKAENSRFELLEEKLKSLKTNLEEFFNKSIKK
jgi:hypothetical protein